MELLPKSGQFLTHLAHATRGNSKVPSDFARGIAFSELESDGPDALRKTFQPVGDINAARGEFGGSRVPILDENLPPSTSIIMLIQAFDAEMALTAGIRREQVVAIQPTSHPSPREKLANAKPSQGTRRHDVRPSLVLQSRVREEGISHDLGHCLVPGLGIKPLAKGASSPL